MSDWSSDQLRTSLHRKKRATLVFMKLYQRYNTLHSGNCKNPKQYRQTLIKRIETVLPYVNTTVTIKDGYLT